MSLIAMAACSGAKAQDEPAEDTIGVFSLTAPPLPPPRPAVSMVVNLRTQRATVYRDGIRVRSTQISSGKRGYRTPTGTFTVLEKQKVHHSNKYDNAPMPYMQRLSWYGLALHAGHVPGYPASHGCVRMPLSFARWLYSEPTMGMRVVITNERPTEPAVQKPSAETATVARSSEDVPAIVSPIDDGPPSDGDDDSEVPQ